MTDRIERARFLGEQLTAAMIALGEATRGSDALLFLDRLARLESYGPDVLGAVDGLVALVTEARAARTEHAREVGAAAGGGLDLERFLEAGRHLPVDDVEGERDGWLRDLLLIATVRPWLVGDRAELAGRTLDRALAMIEAEPEAFLGASAVSADRREYENPEALGEAARDLIARLTDLPLVVLFERSAAGERADRVDAALARAGQDAVDAADDALFDRELARDVRLPRPGAQIELYAADEPGVVLCRMEAGVWSLSSVAGVVTLRWQPDPLLGAVAVQVEALEGARGGLIPGDARGEFVLPLTSERLALRLRAGPDSRLVHLDPSEG